jgi:hypothetical protein
MRRKQGGGKLMGEREMRRLCDEAE